jgi:hypothetical protein
MQSLVTVWAQIFVGKTFSPKKFVLKKWLNSTVKKIVFFFSFGGGILKTSKPWKYFEAKGAENFVL